MAIDLVIAITLTASAAVVVWILCAALPAPASRRAVAAIVLVVWFAVVVTLGASQTLAPEHLGPRLVGSVARRGSGRPRRHVGSAPAGTAVDPGSGADRRQCRQGARRVLPDPACAGPVAGAVCAKRRLGGYRDRGEGFAGRLGGCPQGARMATDPHRLEYVRPRRSRRAIGLGVASAPDSPAAAVHRSARHGHDGRAADAPRSGLYRAYPGPHALGDLRQAPPLR